MKYITSMALIALLVLSMVPLVIAEDALSVDTSVQATARDVKVSTDASANVRVKSDELSLQERAKATREARSGVRVEASARFKELRTEFQAKRADYKTSVDELRSEKDALRQCKDKTDETCVELRTRAKVQVQGVLANAAERLTSAIAKAQYRIDNSKLSDEDKATLKASLDAETAKVADLQAKIGAINDATTKSDIQALNKEARALWNEIKGILQNATSRLASTKLAGVIVRAEHLSDRLNAVVEKAKADGKDTGDAEAKLAELNADLDAAKTAQEAAASLTGKDRNEKIREANEKLKSAHQTLMEIVKSLKDVKVDVDSAVSTDNEQAETSAEASAEAEA